MLVNSCFRYNSSQIRETKRQNIQVLRLLNYLRVEVTYTNTQRRAMLTQKKKRLQEGEGSIPGGLTSIGNKEKEPSTSHPHSPPPLEAEDNIESYSKKVRSEKAKYIDALPINVHHSSLDLTPASIPTIEYGGTLEYR